MVSKSHGCSLSLVFYLFKKLILIQEILNQQKDFSYWIVKVIYSRFSIILTEILLYGFGQMLSVLLMISKMRLLILQHF